MNGWGQWRPHHTLHSYRIVLLRFCCIWVVVSGEEFHLIASYQPYLAGAACWCCWCGSMSPMMDSILVCILILPCLQSPWEQAISLRDEEHINRVDSWFVPSQWEMALLCNDVSHWLGASVESALIYILNSFPIDFYSDRIITKISACEMTAKLQWHLYNFMVIEGVNCEI